MKIDLSTANLYPRTICTYCANEITSLMNALRGMYGLRRVCLAAVGAIAAAGTMHLQNLPEPTASANLTQTLRMSSLYLYRHQSLTRTLRRSVVAFRQPWLRTACNQDNQEPSCSLQCHLARGRIFCAFDSHTRFASTFTHLLHLSIFE